VGADGPEVGICLPALARPKVAGMDPEPKTSHMLKKALVELFDGKPDPAVFTPVM
jgi:hypothetical protein